jgi:hypothetical protein
MIYLLIVVACATGAYLLFRDTLNRIQYLQSVRLYWITRDNGVAGTKVLTRAFMRQTASPWWRGSGIQIRVGKHTFQIGVLTSRANSLLEQVDGRELDDDAKAIRAWGRRDGKEGDQSLVHPQG